METQLKKGVLELCVLAALSKRDMYGYELVHSISTSIAVTEGTIYPLLRRLKLEGHLTTYLKESREGPPRKYYQLTKEGIQEYSRLQKEWLSFNKKITGYLKKLGV